MKIIQFTGIAALLIIATVLNTRGQTAATKPGHQKHVFIHPGMMQSRADLDFMRTKVNQGEQPWKNAFDLLKSQTPLHANPKPYTHISQGPYGAGDMGGKQLLDDANAAYNNAILWYITRNRLYASNAIRILNAWSYTLWDFDGNNAKLLTGLSGYYLLNAAEILRYSDAGWAMKDIAQFKKLMLTVYYPLIKNFFPEANGNWDASMTNTMMCIAIFCNDNTMFNRAINEYLHGTGNGGITKYIYPGGQVQESTRDWGHVQLGLGEFAKAVQVAWTQGIDLYSVADDRLASGFEYASKYMLGGDVTVYGVISPRERGKFRDIYESIYDHYLHIKGIKLPYTGRVIQKTRPTSSLALLVSLRAYNPISGKITGKAKLPDSIALYTGATDTPRQAFAGRLIINVAPGEPIQAALDKCAGKNGIVVLQSGVYKLQAPLRIPSGITLSGQGKQSVLFLDPSISARTLVNADDDMHDVTINNIMIEGATSISTGTDPNNNRRIRSSQLAASREGILFQSKPGSFMHNITLKQVTVQNCTQNGVSISGAQNVIIDSCNFSDNGGAVAPGPGLQHNLLLNYVEDCKITDSRFDTSPWGSGINITTGSNIVITGSETARNKLQGIRCADCDNVLISNDLSEGNDENGILVDVLANGNKQIIINHNISRNNGTYGISINASDKKIAADKFSCNALGDVHE